MYLNRDIIRTLEERYGVPETATAAADFAPREFEPLRRCGRKGQAHDVTLLIRSPDGRFALIRKPSYPPEVFRPPSGGIEPAESFEQGAAREALEETGLEIRLERYLLRVQACFHCDGAASPWTTHVFSASNTSNTSNTSNAGTVLAPRDQREIAEARWGTVEEMVQHYRPAMLAIGSAGMRYRVELQDAALRVLGLWEPPRPEGSRVIQI